jgi:hypothetical protein
VKSRKAPPGPLVLATLHDWYRGEVGGEALFLALAARASESARSQQWRTLAALEAATRARLGAAITGLGYTLPEQTPDPDLAPRRLAELADKSWPELMHWLAQIATDAYDVMAREAGALPVELAPVASWVLEHEEALVDFATRELACDAGDSLEHARRMLATFDTN